MADGVRGALISFLLACIFTISIMNQSYSLRRELERLITTNPSLAGCCDSFWILRMSAELSRFPE